MFFILPSIRCQTCSSVDSHDCIRSPSHKCRIASWKKASCARSLAISHWGSGEIPAIEGKINRQPRWYGIRKKAPLSPATWLCEMCAAHSRNYTPKWDDPFVVLASSDKDTYKLATANGYIIKNLINVTWLRNCQLMNVFNTGMNFGMQVNN